MAGYVEAFSDLDHEIHEMVAEDGRVITWITYNGTHDVEFLEIEPTGIRVEVEEFLSFRIAGGEIVDLHWLGNDFDLLRQLGADLPVESSQARKPAEIPSKDRDLAADVNENLRTIIMRMATHVPDAEIRRFASILVASTGIPVPIFNRALIFEALPRDDLRAAVAWLTERDVPFWVTVASPVADAAKDHAAELDLELTDEHPGMALSPLDEIPPNESAATISMVNDSDGLDDFITVFAEVFDLPLESVQQVTPTSLPSDDTIHSFVGRVDGQAVACGQLVQSGEVAGVYTIGVDEAYRREGIGEAMTWEVLRAGRDAGCQVGVLQSPEMAYPLYE